MKVMVVYDSVFGNTEKIGQAIGAAVGSIDDVKTLRINKVKPEQVLGVDYLIVGSPTRQFNPTGAINNFLKSIPSNGLKGVNVTAFDTRIALSDINSSIGRFFIRTFGYAAEKMQRKLEKMGGKPIIPPEGFLVNGAEGPLKSGELERAGEWAKQICAPG